MVDTAGTLCRAAQALKDEGATKVVAYITHPVLSGDAVERISESALDELVVTDTIPLSDRRQGLRAHPPAVGRGAARRDHPPHPRRGVGELAVRGLILKGCAALVAVAAPCCHVRWRKSCVFHSHSARTAARCKAKVRAAACVARARFRPFCMAASSGPQPLVLDQQNLLTMIGKREVLFLDRAASTSMASRKRRSSRTCRCIRRAMSVVHVDLQRVVENEAIRLRLPIHFKGEAAAPGVKSQGGIVSHMRAGRRGHMPAEGSAGVSRDRSVGDEPERDAVPVRYSSAAGCHHPGARPSQRSGGLDPQPACCGAGAGCGGSGCRCGRSGRGRGRSAAAGAGAAPAAPRARRKKRRKRRRPRRKAARNSAGASSCRVCRSSSSSASAIPASEYARTRHNAGFGFVEELARRHGGQFPLEPRHNGELARVGSPASEVWLLKPMAFMNRSGDAVRSVSAFYKAPPSADPGCL